MDLTIGGALRCHYSAGVNKPQNETALASIGPVPRHHGKIITTPANPPPVRIVSNPHVKSSITTLPLLCHSARSFITSGVQTGGKATVIILGILWTQLRLVQALDIGNMCRLGWLAGWHATDGALITSMSVMVIPIAMMVQMSGIALRPNVKS